MQINIDDLMKNSFVISIYNERYYNFSTVFKNNNLSIPKLFKGFTINNGVQKNVGLLKTKNYCNCSLSHMSLIKYAQMNNLPFICIFEDDAYPCLNITHFLSIILNNLPENCDILKLGITKCPKNDMNFESNNIHIIKNVYSYGSHAYIIFQKYYETYLDICDYDMLADGKVLNNDNANIFIVSKILFIQYSLGLNSMHNTDLRQLEFFGKKYLNDNFRINI